MSAARRTRAAAGFSVAQSKPAGSFRETLTFTDSTARDCTSDNQYWTASPGGL